MLAFVIVLQVLVALFLIMVVLLQPGNRGGASAALGGAGSDTVFGGRGANTFLSKITFGAAVAFMVTNFLLSYMSSTTNNSVTDALKNTTTEKKAEVPQEAPAQAEPNSEAPAHGAQEKVPADGHETVAPALPKANGEKDSNEKAE